MLNIKKFLQKRKVYKSKSQGMHMVVIAYVLSFILLAFGSDSLYNIKSGAKETSIERQEETHIQDKKVASNETANNVATSNMSIKTSSSLPTKAVSVLSVKATISKEEENLDDTKWFMGQAMNDDEYNEMLSEIEAMEIIAEPEPEIEIASFSIEDNGLSFTEEEIIMLERIVEAEATGEDMKGKILIINVVMNRINNQKFPDTVEEVIFQKVSGKYQFSPVSDKRYWNVKVTEESKEAVQRALDGEDYSEGALFFMARKRANKNNVKWFDQKLKSLFTHGGHEFFTHKA